MSRDIDGQVWDDGNTWIQSYCYSLDSDVVWPHGWFFDVRQCGQTLFFDDDGFHGELYILVKYQLRISKSTIVTELAELIAGRKRFQSTQMWSARLRKRKFCLWNMTFYEGFMAA